MVLVALMWVCYPRLKRGHTPGVVTTLNYLKQGVVAVLILGVGVLSARGGFQMKPLRIITAATYTSAQNVALVLNSPFTIMQTMKKKEISGKIYFQDKADLLALYNPEQHFDSASARWSKPNVVIFILESFSSEYTGFFGSNGGYTPFLDSIAAHSWAFQNAYANGKRSIEAVPSILASIPALIDDPYITTRYGSDRINTLPEFLREMGYNTSFFHGGHNGTMGFDAFAAAAGIEKYYGKNEYTGPNAEDGGWGIYDEEFLQYFSKELTSFKQPFLPPYLRFRHIIPTRFRQSMRVFFQRVSCQYYRLLLMPIIPSVAFLKQQRKQVGTPIRSLFFRPIILLNLWANTMAIRLETMIFQLFLLPGRYHFSRH